MLGAKSRVKVYIQLEWLEYFLTVKIYWVWSRNICTCRTACTAPVSNNVLPAMLELFLSPEQTIGSFLFSALCFECFAWTFRSTHRPCMRMPRSCDQSVSSKFGRCAHTIVILMAFRTANKMICFGLHAGLWSHHFLNLCLEWFIFSCRRR